MSSFVALRSDVAPIVGSSLVDLAALSAAPLQRDPFDFLVVPHVLPPAALAAVNADFPPIEGPSNYKPEELQGGPAFTQLLAELEGPEFAAALGNKFGIDLSTCSKSIGVRGFCEPTDGHIHTDHRSKVITVLVYFNEDWPHEGGRLRMLRSATDIEDYAAEIDPMGGTLLAFRRSDHSFHGHKQFVGERRMLQLSHVQDSTVEGALRQIGRLTKPVRRLFNMS
jgi:hypothetical protein